MKLDILAIGVHPDDIELGCSGTIINEINNGKKVGIVDLTQGELGTRGSVESRYTEAANAATIMGVHIRENLKMADGFFKNDETHQRLLIHTIRKYQPEIILANVLHDRHPDHGRAGQLITTAAFLSGLMRIETLDGNNKPQGRWRPKYVLHYIQDRFLTPNFVVDITAVFEEKLESIKAYATQFHNPGVDGPQTYISTPDFLDSIIYRSKMLGKMIGVKYAEGFISEKMIGIKSLEVLIKENT